jgi:iron complex outermembrane receptor protein
MLGAAAWGAEQPSLALPEVTVTAKGADVTERRDSTTQKVVLGRKEIEDLGVMTVGEVLGKLPGVEVPAGGGMRARGMSRDSVRILVDGESSAGGSAIMAGVVGRLPSGELERVEILRGSSAEHGGAAFVSVNLIMKRALPKRSTSVKAGVGFRGDEPNGQLSWTENWGEGGLGWALPVTLNLHRNPLRNDSDEQDATAGVPTLRQKESSDGVSTFREFVFQPRMTWKKGGDSFTFSPLYFNGLRKSNSSTSLSEFADPAAGTGAGYNGDRTSNESSLRQLVRLRADGEKLVGENKFSGRIALNGGKMTADTERTAHDAASAQTVSTDNSDSSEREINTALRFDKPFGEHLLAIGLEYVNLKRTDEQSFTGNYVSDATHDAREQHAIAWIQGDWKLHSAVTVTAGLRGENIRLESDAVSNDMGRLLPSLAIRWEPMDKWVLRSSIGAGVKMPRLEELSDAVAPSIAENTPVTADKRGNPHLVPEQNINFEAVLERYLDKDSGVLGMNVYVRSTRDFTERNVLLEGSRWVDRPYNQGKALHWGVELDAKMRTDSSGWKGATVKAHLTLPKARVHDTRLGITRMAMDTPKYTFSTGLDQSLPALNSSFGVTLKLSGRSKTDVPGEVQAHSEAKATLDAFWLYKLTAKLNLRCSGQNLSADNSVKQTTYTSAGNSWQLTTDDSGYRTLLVTLEGRW